MIGHLIFIAGPSGGRKSTFMAQLSDNALPGELGGVLPAAAPDWPHTDCKTFLRSEPPSHTPKGKLAELEELICHYDIMRMISLGYSGYSEDPDTSVLDAARQVTIVSLLPDRERLLAQLAGRVRQEQERRSTDLLRRLSNALLRCAPGAPKPGQQRLVAHYGRDGRFNARYAEWLDYVAALCRGREDRRALRIDVAAAAPDMLTFRLAADGGFAGEVTRRNR